MRFLVIFLLIFTLFSDVFADDLVNYPNPFSSNSQTTKLRYTLTSDAEVNIKIFDLFGKLVFEKTINAGETYAKSGLNEYPWDGKNNNGEAVRSGGYICKLIIKYSSGTVVLKRKISVVN